MPNLENLGQCPTCKVPNQERFWRLRYPSWPKLNWGLLLGCGLARFTSSKGKIIPAMNRFFTIIVSTSMYLIWNLRNTRVLETSTQIEPSLVLSPSKSNY
ncbi:hypothetical protein DFH07DRAFT_820169 [Mycena maculata]|uniref:Uncharacterized protein n=1 Tax=Mycena maculata TaxID=230809 RepID=A0AAD7J6R2_9AGAR|nr:hypothetical protein DFH07DRAFT_820169 [Mycena maculata]